MKAVLFDFGGTLDSNGISCRDVLYCIYTNCGLKIERDKFDHAFYDADDNLPVRHNLKSSSFEDTFRLHIKDLSANLKITEKQTINKISNLYLSKTRKYFKQNIALLSKLKKNYKLGVISNFFGNLGSVLKSEGLLDFFDMAVDSRVAGYLKPDPKIFMHALNGLGITPRNALMVGDSIERDIKGARNLDMQSALLWGDRFETNAPPDNLNATIILKNLTELPDKLKEINF